MKLSLGFAILVFLQLSSSPAVTGEGPASTERRESDERYVKEKQEPGNDSGEIDGRAEARKKTEKKAMFETRVTATRIKSEPGKIPYEVQVLDREDMADWSFNNVDEAFSLLTGVWAKRTKPADATPAVFVRGFSQNKRNLVMLNGLPLNGGYAGSVPWWMFSVDLVDRIELLSGPASPMYGGYAMGGAVNIVSSMPRKRDMRMTVTAGSFETGRISASYADTLGDWFSYRVFAHWGSAGGYPSSEVVRKVKDGVGDVSAAGGSSTTTSKGDPAYFAGHQGDNYHHLYGGGVELFFKPWRSTKIRMSYQEGRFSYGYSEPETFLKTETGEPIYDGTATVGEGRYISLKPYNFLGNFSSNICRIAGLEAKSDISDWLALSAKLGAVHREGWYSLPKSGADVFGGPGKYNFTQSLNVYSEVQLTAELFENNTAAGGITLFFPEATSSAESLENWRDVDSRSGLLTSAHGKSVNTGIFLQDQWRLLDEKITISAGGRVDIWHAYDGESKDVKAERSDTYEASTVVSFNPRLGISYNPWDFIGVKAAAGRSFRPPTVYELYKTWEYYGTTYKSNPDLEPEIAWSWEAGLTSHVKQIGLKAQAVWFTSYVDNIIYLGTVDDTTKQYMNAAKATIEGLELSLKENFREFLEAGIGVTYQFPEITENPAKPETEGKIMTQVPKNIYFGWLKLRYAGLLLGIKANWVGKAYYDDQNKDTYSGVYKSFDEHFLLDAAVKYTMPNMAVGLTIQNLLDESYYSYYRAPGRSFYASLTVNY